MSFSWVDMTRVKLAQRTCIALTSTFEKCTFSLGCLQAQVVDCIRFFIHFNVMARRKLSEATRWQIIGMRNAGMSLRQIGTQIGRHHSIISKLLKKYRATNEVKDLPRPGRPRKTTVREDRALLRLVRRRSFDSSSRLRQEWLPGRPISNRTVRNRLKAAGYRARRPIKRPRLSPAHKAARLAWCNDRLHWNIASWRKVHFSDESRFLLHMVDGRTRVWRQRNTAMAPRNIQETVAFGGGSVMVWGCISMNCKLDIITIRGNLNGVRYQQEVLDRAVVPHFENHPLATRPIFMDDNARPHRAHAVNDFLRQNAIDRIPWPAMSPDLNPIEHLWDFLGRRVRQRDPPVHNLNELTAALHEEWNRIPQNQIRRLIQGMRRRLESVVRAQGGHTRY